MIKFFELNDNFEEIIKKALPNEEINKIKQISTGWTNIVYEVNTKQNENYFFRFPRDEFWSKAIVKDYEFCKFIKGKTTFKTTQLKLLYDNGRPFSMHKKIEGTVLADKMNDLSEEEIKTVSQDIAKFMYQMHNIEFNKNEIFTVDNIGCNLIDFLNELLDVHIDTKNKVFWKYEEFSKKDNEQIVHGDLNPSNILLDETNHISAVIDFGFSGFGNKYFDIARIIGRCPENFKKQIINSYEELSNKNLNYNTLNEEIDIWNNIDGAYKNYMKKIGIY